MSNNLTTSINSVDATGNTIQDSVSLDDTSDGRGVATLTVKDLSGTQDYQPFQTVTLQDAANGDSFSGYINDTQQAALPPSAGLLHTLNTVDQHYLADKRYYSGPEFQYRFAGDIATALLEEVLSQEGVTASYAVDNDQSISDWSTGTFSDTVVTNNISGGDLELAPSGSAKSKIENTTAAFNAGTLVNVQATNNTLVLASSKAIKLTGTAASGYGNPYFYNKIWGGSYTIASGDTLEYDVWISSTSPAIEAGVDGLFTLSGNNYTLRDYSWTGPGGPRYFTDQQGLHLHPSTDLSVFAKDQWYTRQIDLSQIAGATLNTGMIALEGNSQGDYAAYFRHIKIVNGGTTKLTIFESSLNANTFVSNVGYSNVSCTAITAYAQYGYRISPSTSLSSVGIVNTSSIDFIFTDYSNSTLALDVSFDGGVTWQPATANQAIPGLTAGMNTSSLSLLTRVRMNITDTTPEVTPVLNEISWEVNPSYVCTKTDGKLFDSFGGGTNSNTVVSGGNLALNGQWRNWDDASKSNQTLFSSDPNGSDEVIQGQYLITCTAGASVGTDVRSRLDFAGSWTNFTCEFDVLVPAVGNAGLVYHTTNWASGANSFGYNAAISTTLISLGYGANNNVGTTFTTIQNVNLALNAGDIHRMKIIVNGNNHQIYLDDTLYINVNDSTYPSGSDVAFRFWNNDLGNTHSAFFDNFGIVSNLIGTHNSGATAIGSIGTVGSSIIQWNDSVPSGASIDVSVSTDNSTWTSCTNGQPIPNFGAGTVISGGTNLYVKTTITASYASANSFLGTDNNMYLSPVVHGVSWYIAGAFSASGNRISEGLDLTPVGKLGNTLVAFSGIQPNNTGIAVDTSLDGVTWTQAATSTPVSGGSTTVIGSGNVYGLQVQVDPIVDTFSENTSADYTSSYQAVGGSLATWTWNTASKQLQASGGSHAFLLYNSPTNAADTDISAILTQADAASFIWRWQDQGHFYSLDLYDDSAASHPSSVRLNVVVASNRTLLQSVSISFPRGTPHAFRVLHVGSSISVTMDGQAIITLTNNTISAAGFAGLGNNTNTSNFYMLRIQYQGQSVSGVKAYTRIRLTSTDPTATPQVVNLSLSAHDTNIQNGALIPQSAYSILNGNKKSLAQIFDDLCKQSGNYVWGIKNFQFYFRAPEALPAPFAITTSDVLISNLEIDNQNDAYRNSQWGYGATDIIEDVRAFTGDGITTTFNVAFPVDSVNSITLNGQAQTVGVKGVDSGKDWYYTQGQVGIVQDLTLQPALTNEQVLFVDYNGQVSVTTNVQNATEIARVAGLDNSTGIIDEAEDCTGLTKEATIVKCAGLLQQWGQSETKVAKFQTLQAGLAVGQLVAIFSVMSIMTDAFLITEVKADWQTTIVNGQTVIQPWYSIVGSNGATPKLWERFISDLAVLN